MRKILLTLLLSACCVLCVNIAFADNPPSTDPAKKDINLTTYVRESKPERDMTHDIQAFYLSPLSELEIECFEEGYVTVSLFNSHNRLCGYTEFDSSEFPIGRIDVPKTSGTYYVMIQTSYTYAEGVFVK